MRYSQFRITENYLLKELTDKVKQDVIQKFTQQNPDVEKETIEQFVNLWDRYAASFKPEYRDITRLNWPVVQRLIADADTRAHLKGKNSALHSETEPNAELDTLYNQNNLVIMKGDMREKCIKYGEGYTWCISRRDSQNMFYSYRMRLSEPSFYFVFDKDKPKTDVWHVVVIYINNIGQYHVASADKDNPGEVEMTWDQIEQKQPKLRGLQKLFVVTPLTKKELADYKKYGNWVNLATYRDFSLYDKYKYIMFGHAMDHQEQQATPNELIGTYAKINSLHITKETWDRLKPSDKRMVAKNQIKAYDKRQYIHRSGYVAPEAQVHAVKENPHGIIYIDDPVEEAQLIAVKRDYTLIADIEKPTDTVKQAALDTNASAIIYIKDPTPEMQMQAAKEKPHLIAYIKNPTPEVQAEAVKHSSDAIRHIENPSIELQKLAIETHGPIVLPDIKNPDPNLILDSYRQLAKQHYIKINDTDSIRELESKLIRDWSFTVAYIVDHSLDTQMYLAKNKPELLSYVNKPDQRVQMYLAKNNPDALKSISSKLSTETEIYLNSIGRDDIATW